MGSKELSRREQLSGLAQIEQVSWKGRDRRERAAWRRGIAPLGGCKKAGRYLFGRS